MTPAERKRLKQHEAQRNGKRFAGLVLPKRCSAARGYAEEGMRWLKEGFDDE